MARIWCILVNIPWTLEKNVYSAVISWNSLYMSIRFCCVVQIFFFLMIFLYRSSESLKEEVLKFTIKIVNLFISPFLSINIYFTYFETFLVGAYVFRIIISSFFFYYFRGACGAFFIILSLTIFPALLKYNWHITFCKFKVYNMVI